MTHPFDYSGQIRDREKMIAILEARIDCHAGPGTATPACGACVSCLLHVIESLEKEKAALTTRVSVLDGSACAEERAEGNGGCGMCAWCCKEALTRAETAEIKNTVLRTNAEHRENIITRLEQTLDGPNGLRARLRNAEAVAQDELEDLKCLACEELSGHAEKCVRGPVLRVLQALRKKKK